MNPNNCIGSSLCRFTFGSSILVLMLGCGAQDEIRRYQAPKPAQTSSSSSGTESAAAEQRMLAAIVHSDDKDWFFKVMGPTNAVAQGAESFRSLLGSVRFEAGKPKWNLPEDWREKPGSGMRFATLEFDAGDEALEVSIMALPRQSDLANVNRWRGQLSLPPISETEMDTKTEKVEFDGGTAILVDLVGTAGSGGMGRAPFAGGGPMRQPSTTAGGSQPQIGPQPAGGSSGASTGQPSKKFAAPAEWSPGKLVVARGGITLRHEAAFEVTDSDKRVEITVDRMPAGGGLLANINRWRRQIQLEPLSADELEQESQKVEIDGKARDYVKLVGPDETILGVVAEEDGMAWYMKLKGDKQLAEQERERFEEFVKTLELR